MKESKMQLVDYQVCELKITRNDDFEDDGKAINITSNIERGIFKIDKNNVAVFLRVTLPREKSTPFYAYVEIMGSFYLENWENGKNKSFIEENACAILFPFLRTSLSSLISLAGFPPYNLPIYDLRDKDDN